MSLSSDSASTSGYLRDSISCSGSSLALASSYTGNISASFRLLFSWSWNLSYSSGASSFRGG